MNSLMQLVSTLKAVRAYWRPMIVMVFGALLYSLLGELASQMKAEVSTGESPQVALLAGAGLNMVCRLAALALIVVAAIRASKQTILPSVVLLGLAFVASVMGLSWHVWASLGLSAGCFLMTCLELTTTGRSSTPAS